jgi:ABC-2 type transport system permease protein
VNMHKAWLVFKKDWLEIKRNGQVLAPIIILPLILSVIFPIILVFISNAPTQNMGPIDIRALLIHNLPPDIQAQLAQFTETQIMVYFMVLYLFAPFFLLIPILASSVIGSDSFAGERERKTIEALLATPISDSELLLGKILVSFIPAMLITFVAFGVYAIIVDVITFGMFNGMLLLPNVNFLIMVFGVAPTIALCSIGLTVIISAKVKGFKEAQQISAVLVFPVIGLVLAQVSGSLVLGPIILAALMILLAVVDVAIFYFGVKIFQREEILSRPA